MNKMLTKCPSSMTDIEFCCKNLCSQCTHHLIIKNAYFDLRSILFKSIDILKWIEQQA